MLVVCLTACVLGAFAVRGDGHGFAKLLLLAVMQVTPFFVCVANYQMDYLSVILGAEFVGYSLGPLVDFITEPNLTRFTQFQLQAFDLLIVSTILLLFIFYLGRLVLYSKPHAHENFRWIALSPKAGILLGVLLLFSFVVSSHIPPEMQQFFLSAQFILTCLVFCIEIPGDRVIRWSLYASVLAGILYSFLLYTNLGFAINLAVIWLTQTVLNRQWKSLAKLGLLLVYMVCLQSVKYNFREQVGQNPHAGVVSRSQILIRLLERKFLDDRRAANERPQWLADTGNRIPTGIDTVGGTPYDALSAAMDRAHDESLERVIQLTPSVVPYWEGESYFNFPYLLLPRAIWPSKPVWSLWNDFGHRYFYLRYDDSGTYVLFSYFAEGYMNYGRAGVLWVTVFLGILFVALEKISDYDDRGYYSFTFIAVLMPLLAYQTDLGSMLVRVIYTVVSALLLRIFFLNKVIKGERPA